MRFTGLVVAGALGLLGCGDDGGGSGGSASPTAGAGVGGAGVGGATAGVGGAAGSPVLTGGGTGGSTQPPVAGAAAAGSGGAAGTGGASGAGAGGAGGMVAGAGGSAGGSAGGGGSSSGPMLEGNFSFFVTSVESLIELSGNDMGFGGDLGGLAGADEICQTIAAKQGAGHKTWRAFLSATAGGEGGGAVNAIDRIGEGPWYDRLGRLVAMNRQGLLQDRPDADPAIADNLPNENGEPLNRNGDDDHDTLTGSNAQGQLAGGLGDTCNDWTSAVGATGRPQIGHAWPAFSGTNWIASHNAPGCAPCVALVQTGPPPPGSDCVGGGGGYGGFYCFATTP